jgi:hypothetical protein
MALISPHEASDHLSLAVNIHGLSELLFLVEMVHQFMEQDTSTQFQQKRGV